MPPARSPAASATGADPSCLRLACPDLSCPPLAGADLSCPRLAWPDLSCLRLACPDLPGPALASAILAASVGAQDLRPAPGRRRLWNLRVQLAVPLHHP